MGTPRSTLHRVQAALRPRVGAKFFLTVGVLVPAVLSVAAVGAFGLQRMADRTDDLYTRSLPVRQHTADVVASTLTIHETALYQVAVHDARLDDRLTVELDETLIPQAEAAIAVLRQDYADGSASRRTVEGIDAGLQKYLQLRRTGVYEAEVGTTETEQARTALARRTDGLLEPMVSAARVLAADEARDTVEIKAQSDATYLSTNELLGASVAIVLLLGLAVVLALIRNMVPRIRRYSEFAAAVAAGQTTSALEPGGHDELTELGEALNEMVLQRDRASREERTQRELLALGEQEQAEFVETLQVTRSEQEAQDLLQRHLQRALPGSTVAVLRSNNSANRLEAATAPDASTGLTDRLVGAEPRSCIAVRLGRHHREGTGRPPLLGCILCATGDRVSTCEPLLVGGEVIGSVLVTHPEAVSEADDTQIRTTVAQAAPVLANLRSLALAEFRASNDSLTGLPNKRATEDTLKRMVAQAGRSVLPLTAIMLDLDHFKAINDRFGHAQGDQVLASVGIAIQSALRGSDFAGRIGGEEFLILLPDTPLEAGLEVAERVRTTIASITVPGVEREITASLGVAGLLEHSGNATGLLQEADRAQYAAKAAGRNRCVVAALDHTGQPVTAP